jgi:hypothetical protein
MASANPCPFRLADIVRSNPRRAAGHTTHDGNRTLFASAGRCPTTLCRTGGYRVRHGCWKRHSLFAELLEDPRCPKNTKEWADDLAMRIETSICVSGVRCISPKPLG